MRLLSFTISLFVILACAASNTLDFVDFNGKAHVEGKLSEYEQTKPMQIMLVIENQLTHTSEEIVVQPRPDGMFSVDVPIVHPQTAYLTYGDEWMLPFHVAPGDTIVLSMRDMVSNKDYFHADEIKIDTKDRKAIEKEISRMASELKEAAMEDTNDINVMKKAGNLFVELFNLISRYEDSNRIEERDNTGYLRFMGKYKDGYQPFDKAEVLRSIAKVFPAIFNTDALITVSPRAINTLEYGPAFEQEANLATGFDFAGRKVVDVDSIGSMILRERARIKTIYGIPETALMHDLACVRFASTFVYPRADYDSRSMDRCTAITAQLLPVIHNAIMRQALLREYNKYVAGFTINTHKSEIDQAAKAEAKALALIDSIAKPYRGNVLVMDFCGYNCMPCRAGMLKHKEMLSLLADKNFRMLYVAEKSDKEVFEKWMESKAIAGEHIYISDDDWNYLYQTLHMNGIPYALLIGTDGAVLSRDFHISLDDIHNVPGLKAN